MHLLNEMLLYGLGRDGEGWFNLNFVCLFLWFIDTTEAIGLAFGQEQRQMEISM